MIHAINVVILNLIHNHSQNLLKGYVVIAMKELMHHRIFATCVVIVERNQKKIVYYIEQNIDWPWLIIIKPHISGVFCLWDDG